MKPSPRTPEQIHTELCAALDPGLAEEMARRFKAVMDSPRWATLGQEFELSRQQTEVARLLCASYGPAEIARALNVTVNTAKTYIRDTRLKCATRRADTLKLKVLLRAGLLRA